MTALTALAILPATPDIAVANGSPPPGSQVQTVDSQVQAGSNGTVVGSSTFTRILAANGTETVQIHLSVPGGINESSVCYGDSAYTSRIPPGQCPLQQGGTGTTADYTVSPALVGKTVYFQVHVDTGSDTAFAGWQPGKPFYGNVAVNPVGGGTPVPVGTFGGLGLAVLAGGALAVVLRRRRPAVAV